MADADDGFPSGTPSPKRLRLECGECSAEAEGEEDVIPMIYCVPSAALLLRLSVQLNVHMTYCQYSLMLTER